MAQTSKPDPMAMRAAMVPAILAHLRELREAGRITARQAAALEELERQVTAPMLSPVEVIGRLEELASKVDAGQGTELERWRVGVFRQVMGRVRARST